VRTSDRDALQGRITKAGIGTLIHYPIPPHMQKAYADMDLLPDAFPLARDLASEVLSLPMGPQLGLDQVQDIVNELKNA
jgi:dTDP-4-amino-4,6-dideoxygalactose transaminase